MPVWLVTPDFVDYDLYKAAVVVAPTKKIDTRSSKIVLADYNAG